MSGQLEKSLGNQETSPTVTFLLSSSGKLYGVQTRQEHATFALPYLHGCFIWVLHTVETLGKY